MKADNFKAFYDEEMRKALEQHRKDVKRFEYYLLFGEFPEESTETESTKKEGQL